MCHSCCFGVPKGRHRSVQLTSSTCGGAMQPTSLRTKRSRAATTSRRRCPRRCSTTSRDFSGRESSRLFAQHPIAGRTPKLQPDYVLAEIRHPLGLLEYNARIVGIHGAGRVTLEFYRRVRPDRNARATVTAGLIAHDVTPFRSIHEAVAVGKRGHILVQRYVVSRTDDVADLVRDRIGQRRTRVMDDDKRLIGIGSYASG